MYSVGDMGMALAWVPHRVGNGAAMAATTPTVTLGFVIGSIVMMMPMMWFVYPGAETAERAAAEIQKHTGPRGDLHGNVVWVRKYRAIGYQIGFAMCFVQALFALWNLTSIQPRRAYLHTTEGMREEQHGARRGHGGGSAGDEGGNAEDKEGIKAE